MTHLTGVLYVRRGTVLRKLMHGAGHESDQRAGWIPSVTCQMDTSDMFFLVISTRNHMSSRCRRVWNDVSTENVLHMAGLGKACEIAVRDFEMNAIHNHKMKNTLLTLLRQKFEVYTDVRAASGAQKVIYDRLDGGCHVDISDMRRLVVCKSR